MISLFTQYLLRGFSISKFPLTNLNLVFIGSHWIQALAKLKAQFGRRDEEEEAAYARQRALDDNAKYGGGIIWRLYK
jgi:hypothetical protein